MQTLLDRFYHGQTLVFGHRGASAYAPMNTLPAFELAAEQGADGIELDVWLSKDGTAVILHDGTVDGTTDGHGFIWDMTLAEIKTLDASHRFAATHPNARIPSLAEVFESVGRRLLVNVEIKADPAMNLGVEQVVADMIIRHKMEQRVVVSSFSAEVLGRFRAVMPQVPIGFLHAPNEPGGEREHALIADIPHEADHPHHSEIDVAYMTWARAHGYRVNTWTVDDPLRAGVLQALGVDAVITNTPDVILAALRG